MIPGILFGIMFAWPWIDRRIYHDFRSHNLLDRPRDKPFRTGVGVAAVIFFSDLTVACGDDLLANDLHIPYERIVEFLQYGVFVGPIAGFLIAYKTCQHLLRTEAHPIQRPVGGIIYRTAEGGYHTLGDVHGNGHGEHGNGRGPDDHGDGGDRGHAVAEPRGAPDAQAPEPVGETDPELRRRPGEADDHFRCWVGAGYRPRRPAPALPRRAGQASAGRRQ